jgi:hypothetical protein
MRKAASRSVYIIEITPQPPLRGTFSRKGRRGKSMNWLEAIMAFTALTGFLRLLYYLKAIDRSLPSLLAGEGVAKRRMRGAASINVCIV